MPSPEPRDGADPVPDDGGELGVEREVDVVLTRKMNRRHGSGYEAVPLERLPGQTGLGDVRVLLTFSSRLVPWKTQ